jgi:formate-dependent phosphoribosylglycinamide formyltransferase (GAR transformylase)
MRRQKILLLGSGELGKEVTIALQRLGQYVVFIKTNIHHN